MSLSDSDEELPDLVDQDTSSDEGTNVYISGALEATFASVSGRREATGDDDDDDEPPALLDADSSSDEDDEDDEGGTSSQASTSAAAPPENPQPVRVGRRAVNIIGRQGVEDSRIAASGLMVGLEGDLQGANRRAPTMQQQGQFMFSVPQLRSMSFPFRRMGPNESIGEDGGFSSGLAIGEGPFLEEVGFGAGLLNEGMPLFWQMLSVTSPSLLCALLVLAAN